MTFGIVGNISKPVIQTVTRTLLSYFREHGIAYVLHEGLGNWLNASGDAQKIEDSHLCTANELPNRCQMLIALGGDGTMLNAARMVGESGLPLLGVNLGKLGFLAEISVDEMRDCIEKILKGEYLVEERMVLQATTTSDERIYRGLNEIVVDKGASPRIIELETFVDGDYLVTYAADGIILTTPTGSTAYSLASGGPIVAPQCKVITINPIAPHTLSARPVVVPEDSIIRVVISSETKPIHLNADGQVEGFYDPPVEIVVRKAPYHVKLVKMKEHGYYDLLRTKLMWGRDVRVTTKP